MWQLKPPKRCPSVHPRNNREKTWKGPNTHEKIIETGTRINLRRERERERERETAADVRERDSQSVVPEVPIFQFFIRDGHFHATNRDNNRNGNIAQLCIAHTQLVCRNCTLTFPYLCFLILSSLIFFFFLVSFSLSSVLLRHIITSVHNIDGGGCKFFSSWLEPVSSNHRQTASNIKQDNRVLPDRSFPNTKTVTTENRQTHTEL
jgi:hypothetical protein